MLSSSRCESAPPESPTLGAPLSRDGWALVQVAVVLSQISVSLTSLPSADTARRAALPVPALRRGRGTHFKPRPREESGSGLHALVVNMRGIDRDGYYDGSIELRDIFNRRCVKCGRGDFAPAKTMRIRTGIVFWNLIFSLMFTCVRGTSHCSNSQCFLMRLVCPCVCVRVRACVCACQKSKALTLQTCAKQATTVYWTEFWGTHFAGFCAQCRLWLSRSIDILAVAYASSNSLRELLCLVG